MVIYSTPTVISANN